MSKYLSVCLSICLLQTQDWQNRRAKIFGVRMNRQIYANLYYIYDGINCVLMIYCALNNNTFKLFLRVHIEFKVVID